jgi:glyoxylase-like metal-dependent hydrolase (beta-lactamase superfamily II)
MATEEILPGVWQVGMGYVNAFLVAREDGVTLVDSGLPGKRRAILKALRQAGRKREELRRIAVTHHHADHMGSLAALVEATDATTYVHPLDAPIVRGERPQPGPSASSIAGKVLGPVLMRLPANRPDAARVDHEVEDGEDLPGGLQAIHTPGHTPGHTSYLLQSDGGVLFVGDAAANVMGRFGKPIGMFTADMEQAKESIRKIAALEFEAACFGHGRVLRGKAHAAFRRYGERLAVSH